MKRCRKSFRSRYGLEVDYARAGSLDMVTADQTGMDYLFPSSQTALSYYTDYYGTAPSNEIILNTPIVLYTHRMVLDAWMKEGIVSEQDGVFSADMGKTDGTDSSRDAVVGYGTEPAVRDSIH